MPFPSQKISADSGSIKMTQTLWREKNAFLINPLIWQVKWPHIVFGLRILLRIFLSKRQIFLWFLMRYLKSPPFFFSFTFSFAFSFSVSFSFSLSFSFSFPFPFPFFSFLFLSFSFSFSFYCFKIISRKIKKKFCYISLMPMTYPKCSSTVWKSLVFSWSSGMYHC